MRYTCVAEGEEDKRHESYGNELLGDTSLLYNTRDV